MEIQKINIQNDPWFALRKFTQARIALGKTGVCIPVHENLQFKMAHAFARDAVYTKLDKENLVGGFQNLGLPFLLLHSKASDRKEYLQRPDLGRRLNEGSLEILLKGRNTSAYDICIIIADGLSATAVNHHALPLLQQLLPLIENNKLSIAPICLIEQGRVAISDETGNILRAKISIIILGERPGLSSPDSLGVYLTYKPVIGNTDESRNCISNIRTEGLAYKTAAEKIVYLIIESMRLKISGIQLKESNRLT